LTAWELGSTLMPMFKCIVGKAFRKKNVQEVYENGHSIYETVRNKSSGTSNLPKSYFDFYDFNVGTMIYVIK